MRVRATLQGHIGSASSTYDWEAFSLCHPLPNMQAIDWEYVNIPICEQCIDYYARELLLLLELQRSSSPQSYGMTKNYIRNQDTPT